MPGSNNDDEDELPETTINNAREFIRRETERLNEELRRGEIGYRNNHEIMRRLLRLYQTRVVDESSNWGWLRPDTQEIRMSQPVDEVYQQLRNQILRSMALTREELESRRILAREATDEYSKTPDTIKVFTYGVHYSIYKLVNHAALVEEGLRLDNCVGNGTYTPSLKAGHMEFYSLRTDDGRVSRALMSITPTTKSILEMFGKNNGLVGVRFQPALKAFIAERGYRQANGMRGGFAIGKKS